MTERTPNPTEETKEENYVNGLPKDWHKKRLKECTKAANEHMKQCRYFAGHRTLLQRIRELFA